MTQPSKIAYQGLPGAHSHLVCRLCFPKSDHQSSPDFETVFESVTSKEADLGVIPIENTTAGRVADIHHLLPNSKAYLVGEYFLPLKQALLGLPGAKTKDIREAYSHIQGLSQCRQSLRKLGIQPRDYADTAGAAKYVAELCDISKAALASPLAAELYGLEVMQDSLLDEPGNTTRFVFIARKALGKAERLEARAQGKTILSALVYSCRSVPAALYKTLGGFATNAIDITKLESYVFEDRFREAQFYVEFVGDETDEGVQHALDEVRFFSDRVKVLGSFPADDFRKHRSRR